MLQTWLGPCSINGDQLIPKTDLTGKGRRPCFVPWISYSSDSLTIPFRMSAMPPFTCGVLSLGVRGAHDCRAVQTWPAQPLKEICAWPPPVPHCFSGCSPFADEKNKETTKGNENFTDAVQGREKKEDGSPPHWAWLPPLAWCFPHTPPPVLSCYFPPYW